MNVLFRLYHIRVSVLISSIEPYPSECFNSIEPYPSECFNSIEPYPSECFSSIQSNSDGCLVDTNSDREPYDRKSPDSEKENKFHLKMGPVHVETEK